MGAWRYCQHHFVQEQYKRLALKKYPAALAVVDHLEMSSEHPDQHAAVMDKVYIGIKEEIRYVFVCLIDIYIFNVSYLASSSSLVPSFQKRNLLVDKYP